MTSEKFVVRLLDGEQQLLAWAEVWAIPKPQRTRASCPFWPTSPTQFVIERDGIAESIAIHWCDLDIARVKATDPTKVLAGQVFTFGWTEPIWLTAGMQGVPLPAVTMRQGVAIGVAAGNIGVRSDVV